MKKAAFLVLVIGCGGGGDDDGPGTPDANTLPSLDCEVAIIGGGAGGLHTAYRLAPEMGEGVCLFEKEAQLGGRIKDEPATSAADSPVFGTGARRVMEGQQVLFDLAAELDVELQPPTPNEADLINARGLFGLSKEDLLVAYPTITPDVSGDTETALYDLLRLGPERANVDDYPDFRAYIRAVAGNEQLAFLHDMSRFRADFEVPLDARGYLDYLDEEWDVCCTPSYPVGGMSAFIRGMEEAAAAGGARIFTEEPASEIHRDGDRYRVVTSGHVVTADRVVIAVPPAAFDWFTGDVAEEIQATAEYKAILGVKVVTVTQWWPSPWWADVVNPDITPATDGNIWRAWTTEHCLNFIEIPLDAYGAGQNATRSVYDDDPNCVELWENLYENGGTAAVEAEIQRGLEFLFNDNGQTTPATVAIPSPTKTHVQIWDSAWHWVRAGTQGSVTNQEIFDWAVEPLGPGDDVAMVGEAYNPQRSGWSDGAYKSSINLLATRYGLDLKPAPTTPRPRAPWGLHRH